MSTLDHSSIVTIDGKRFRLTLSDYVDHSVDRAVLDGVHKAIQEGYTEGDKPHESAPEAVRRFKARMTSHYDAAERLTASSEARTEGHRAEVLSDVSAVFCHLATSGVQCMVVGLHDPVVDVMVSRGWHWHADRSCMRHGDKTIRVARTLDAVRGPNVGALWLHGGSVEMHQHAAYHLRQVPALSVTTLSPHYRNSP